MGYRKGETRQQYNARLNAIMKAKYFTRRAEAIVRLGGKCIDCGTTQMLEFDHKDRSEKEYNVGALFSSASNEKFTRKLTMCASLCRMSWYQDSYRQASNCECPWRYYVE